MASVENFDLYTCKVCLENLLHNSPRLLSCHHSFCTICLEKVMKEGSIICPTCREKTMVTDNNINSLKINFMLQQFKAYADQIHSSRTLLCQFCMGQTAVQKCQQCAQFICEDCTVKHTMLKTFSDHRICKLCPAHKEGMITHFCLKCAKPVCANCIMAEHLEHEMDVTTFAEGLKQLEAETVEYETDIDKTLLSLNNWKMRDQEKIVKMEEAILTVESIKVYFMQKIKETEEILHILQSNKDKGEEITKVYEQKFKEGREMKESLMEGLRVIRNGNFENYNSLKTEVKQLLVELKDKNIRFYPEEVTIIDPRTSKEINLTATEDIYLDKPLLVRNINCLTGRWEKPWNIRHCDEWMLVSDWTKSYITCIYPKSDTKPVTIAGKYGNVRDAFVLENTLYSAYESSLSKRSFCNGIVGPEEIYRPEVTSIYSILVLNESKVYILAEKMGIIAFDPTKNKTNVIVKLQDPMRLSIIKKGSSSMYAVACRATHSVHVFDLKWNLLFQTGSKESSDSILRGPCDCTYNTQGVIVADTYNNRVCLFSFEGKFLKDILPKKSINLPVALTFVNPYLWVTHGGDANVQCYRMCEGN